MKLEYKVQKMWRIGLAAILMFGAVMARAELLIRVTEGRVDAVPIAIVPFEGAQNAPEDVSQIVQADLIPAPGHSIDEEEVIAYCRKNLSTFKIPQKIKVVSEIAMTGSGKIRRY